MIDHKLAPYGALLLRVSLIAGTMLVLGVQTRYASIALSPVLAGATWVHWKNGWRRFA